MAEATGAVESKKWMPLTWTNPLPQYRHLNLSILGGSQPSGLTLNTNLHGSTSAPGGSGSSLQTSCLNRESISFCIAGRQNLENGPNTAMSKSPGKGTSHAGSYRGGLRSICVKPV